MKKYGELNKFNSKDNAPKPSQDDLEFILWKAELNKELLAFWKALTK